MPRSGETSARRRAGNAKALTAFGINDIEPWGGHTYRRVREGNGTTIYTVGYERRSGEELIGILRDFHVALLLDVRDNPISRKADFRASTLRTLCKNAGIVYESWTELGSTPAQRQKLRETRDYDDFRRRFRKFVRRHRGKPLERLANLVKSEKTALLCYERLHDECHRSVLADLVSDKVGATIVAIS